MIFFWLSYIILPMEKALRFIAFDYDGTLVDASLALLKVINNYSKIIKDNKEYSLDDITKAPPLPTLEYFSLFSSKRVSQKQYDEFMLPMRIEEERKSAVAFPNVKKTLKKLKKKGIRLFVLTNRDQRMAKQGAIDMFGESVFDDIIGVKGDGPSKPSREYMESFLNKYGFRPDEGIYVGDSALDVQSAKAVNLRYLIADYKNENKSSKLGITKETTFCDFKDILRKI